MILSTEIIDNVYYSFNVFKNNRNHKFNIMLNIYFGSIIKNISTSHKKITLYSSTL